MRSATWCSLGLMLIMALQGCSSFNLPSETRPGLPTRSSSFAPETADASPRPAPPPDSLPLPEGKLTLSECTRIALDWNPRTRSTWRAFHAAGARVGEAKAAYWPEANVVAGARRSDLVLLERKQETGPFDTFRAGLGARWVLFDGGARPSAVSAANSELRHANFRHVVTLRDLALEVTKAYYELLAAKQLRKVAEETVTQAAYHVALARARHKSGVAARSDVLKAETERADARLASVRTKSNVRIARGRLANVMGLRVSRQFEVADAPQDAHQQGLAEIEQLLDEAAAKRPALRAALARVEQHRAQLRATQARYWPTLSADANYGWEDRHFAPDREEWSAGISLDLPVFTGFRRGHRVRRAKSSLSQSLAEYDGMLRGVELDVWVAYSRVIEATEAIDAADALVASAQESARVAEGEYKSGVGAMVALTDAQTARTEARTRLVQAKLDWRLARAQLERAVGRSLVEE